jgi:putative ABC transport system permease protein
MKVPKWVRWRSDAELDEELQAHLELEIRANLDRGLPPEQAWSAAKRRFGNVTLVKERAREADPFSRLDIFVKDVRYAFRSLARAPGFALSALLTLALGIGANAAIYQLFDAVLLRRLPVRNAGELAIVELADPTRVQGRRTSGPTGYAPLSNPLWERFRDRQDVFQGVMAWANTDLPVGEDSESPLARGLFVSGGFFDVLGVHPFLGRTFTADDDQPGCGVPGAVLSHGFWQRQFGGDPAVIGRTVVLDSQQVPIIGVTPAGFSGVEVGRSYDVAVPLCSQRMLGGEEGWLDDGMTWWLTVMGRLPPTRRLESANAALDVVSPSIFEATLPADYPKDDVDDYLSLSLEAVPGGAGVSSLLNRYGDPLQFLMAMTGLVLLLACTNLANLILARSSAREHELAVRRAIGASSGRLVRQSMVESALLAIAGAAAGLVLAGALSRFLVGFLGAGLSLDLPIDLRLVVFVTGIAALACVTFGAIPAWRASRPTAGDAISNGRHSSSGHRGSGMRKALVVSQMALSLVLVFGAVLFTGTLRNLLAVDTGFDPAGVLVARVDYDPLEIPAASRVAFKRNLLDRIESAPAIASAAEVRHVPLGGTGSSITVWLDGADPTNGTPMRLNAMSEAYLETMGIPVLAGRDFDSRDYGIPVAIVNRTFAARLGLEHPVGERFRVEGQDIVFEIVGLVPDTKHFTLREDFPSIAFVPTGLVPDPRPYTDFMIRSTMPTVAVAAAVRRAVREVSPRIRTDIRPFSETIRDRLLPERLMAALAGFFGVLAALVAAVGLYGVMSSLVLRRTNEIGVRMAFGATRRDILAMALVQALKLLAIGCAVGSVLAFLAAGLARSLVFGLEPQSVGTVGLACVLLAFVAAGACYLPAARAANMQPRDALRGE